MAERRSTRRSVVHEEWDDANDPDDDAAMTEDDIAFCTSTMARFDKGKDNRSMAEHFLDTVNDAAYENIPAASRVDINAINGKLRNRQYGSFNDFRRDIQAIVNNCKNVNSTTNEQQQARAEDLKLDFTVQFARRKARSAASQKAHPPPAPPATITNSTAAPSAPPPTGSSQTVPPVVAPGQTAPPGPVVNPPPRTFTCAVRTPTPGTSHMTYNSFQGKINQDQTRIIPGAHSLGAGLQNDSPVIQHSHESALQNASLGKRKGSPLHDGSRPKQARQEPKEAIHGNLRKAFAGLLRTESRLIHSGKSTFELSEDAQFYVDYLAKLDTEEREVKQDLDLDEIREDYADNFVAHCLDFVHESINDLMTKEGQEARRVPTHTSMEDVHHGSPPEADVKKESRR
ncbi:hypothetical protein VTO58DRAFT_103103 [Aureobasidium pullulans]|nr:hypothetical protein JADG_004320 [Aureobasidium pullulans]